MPIEGWLDTLPGPETGGVDRDLALLAGQDYPLLSPRAVRRQVTRLSAYLGVMDDALRGALIGYSLYTRQLDMLQDRATKHICRDDCARPPLGCCNRSHNVVFSLSDIMMRQPTGLALRMGDALARLQAEEGAHHAGGAAMGERGCPYLTATGCPLHLFKSPLCAHYLCATVTDSLGAAHGAAAAPFVAGMRRGAERQIERSADFTEPGLIEAAVEMFAAEGCGERAGRA
ncbi:hypothetical protein RVX_R04760 [Nitratidesulfovibrio sp. HK-II]|uniref:hypothetical protein n=1 Tax=Nitratidesulfovibrio sp. HK-II TaxID=2009266 RepID=UPI003A5FCF3A